MNHTQHSLSALRAEDGESQKKIFKKKMEYSATSENVDSSYENKYGLVHCQGLFINHRLNFMLTEVVLIPFLSNFSPND